ncbi:MAG TPA: ATP-binding cassette domain-containing protein, partial [Microthrixaceae bacterium]|nr:ATP-binding cassette domain-containing protein [Microthrixaceae bacterium]
SPQQVRSRIGYVEQETPVIPGTIGDNVRFAHPDATEEEVARALAAVRLTEAVDALPEGLDTSLEGDRLSGGQRQRIAVARAILRTPEVLLLDEPTAQVDGITERALQDCIADLSARAAVVTIAHRLSTILDADHIVVMEAGRIRAAGTHTELLATDDLYRELVAALRIREEVVALA